MILTDVYEKGCEANLITRVQTSNAEKSNEESAR